jgi:hypothetical protein
MDIVLWIGESLYCFYQNFLHALRPLAKFHVIVTIGHLWGHFSVKFQKQPILLLPQRISQAIP